MKLLVVLGEGGHTTELLHLVDLLGDRFQYHYIVAQEDALSSQRILHLGPVYRLRRPRSKSMGIRSAVLPTFWGSWQALWILLRVRPAAIVSTGPALAVPVSLMGKLLGVQIIFIETGSRVEALSLTGKMMYRFADLFFVQWPQLKAQLPRAIYAGRLL
jgi:beta-1,4-N-acetylglucosaminyltransferase